MGKPARQRTNDTNNYRPDLQHRDWLLRTITKMVQKVNPHIRIKTKKRGGSKVLVLENILEADLDNLYFLTNTDVNNNYLYLETMQVFLYDDSYKNEIMLPGLSRLMIECWNQADADAFLNNEKTFNPFKLPLNSPHTPGVTSTSTKISVPQYVDIYSSMVPFLPETTGISKVFKLVLNPDCSLTGDSAGSSGCCSSLVEDSLGLCQSINAY